MTYYYIVDNALLENNLTIFEDENEFQDSLNFNLDEAIENEALTPEEANIIVDDFNEYTEVEQEVNGFTYGKTSDKEDLLNTYSLKVEDCDTTDVKLEDDAYGDWRYIIKCEGNKWEEDGFDSVEEAEDNALAKVNELLEDFPEGYAVDDFDITFENEETGESCTYDPYHLKCYDDAYYFDGQDLCKEDYVRDSSQNLFKDTDDCDTIEISDEEVNVPFNQNISFDELRNIFYDHNSENGIKGQFEDKAPLYGNVVISQDSFNKPYSEEERTYVFRSDNKAFLSGMIGNSIISDSKDGSDTGVRLDWYLWDGWKIERCYITKEE